jgi:hypothetical protein
MDPTRNETLPATYSTNVLFPVFEHHCKMNMTRKSPYPTKYSATPVTYAAPGGSFDTA